MSDIFALSSDQTILGLDGNRAANGQIHFYDKATGEYAPVYGDAALRVALRQPVQADSSGLLPIIYLDDAIAYRAVIADRKNNPIREIDDVRRHRPGIKVLDGVKALKRFCGHDPFVLVKTKSGCPVFYKRLAGCDLPAEHLPDVVRAECGCDCSLAWQLCRSEPDICAMETAALNCDYHVLVQECRIERNPDGTIKTKDPDSCDCDDGSEDSAPKVKKASIGTLFSAAAQCLPFACISHDAPELALVGGGLVQGHREPPPIEKSANGAFAGCLRISVIAQADPVSRHLRLDTLPGVQTPKIKFKNPSRCSRRYEIRALNRLNRAREEVIGSPVGHPKVAANFQTRLAVLGDTRLNDLWTVADYTNQLQWLQDFSIADSTMGAFRSGLPWDTGQTGTVAPPFLGANGYTENTLVVDVPGNTTVQYELKYHIYWDMNASTADLQVGERIHFGTRIIAYPIR